MHKPIDESFDQTFPKVCAGGGRAALLASAEAKSLYRSKAPEGGRAVPGANARGSEVVCVTSYPDGIYGFVLS